MDKKLPEFHRLGIATDVLKVIDRLKLVTPTPIQKQAIPPALEGKDVLGVAQTGSGKTLAFGIPLTQRLAQHGGRALILVPTRELAFQVDTVLKPLLASFNQRAAVLIGGLKMSDQMIDLHQNPSVLIATPGRMNDHIYEGNMDLGDIKVLVLDEADRMFDMGFEPQVNSILRCLTNAKQTLLFSATMPEDIRKLVNQHMVDPVSIDIAPSGTTAEDVSHELFIVREDQKDEVVRDLLRKYPRSVLVFTRTKIKASKVTRSIKKMGAKVEEIHSDRSMEQRHRAIEGFKAGRYKVLVATDIASRGIDVSGIELVINYDLPDEPENFVHRIGRTGRAGEEGHAVT
ncbi:MAG: DEAD/DEAH box helicase, partial [Candidatus Omnitrophica bacterium]|nr:DEAD/DEAH box helicase [Candidatus Omnitrophota bacterium]